LEIRPTTQLNCLLVTAVYRVSGNNVENRHFGLSHDPVSLKSIQVLADLENNQ